MTKELLHELFDYKDGKLYWKTFQNHKATAGKEAGWLGARGYRYVEIKGQAYFDDLKKYDLGQRKGRIVSMEDDQVE